MIAGGVRAAHVGPFFLQLRFILNIGLFFFLFCYSLGEPINDLLPLSIIVFGLPLDVSCFINNNFHYASHFFARCRPMIVIVTGEVGPEVGR